MLLKIILYVLSLLNILTYSDIESSGTHSGIPVVIGEVGSGSVLSVSIAVEDILQGVWQVAYYDDDLDLTSLGILLIDGPEYQFIHFPAVTTPSWFSSRFGFIKNLQGSIEFGYLTETGQTGSNVSARPDDKLNEFNNRATLVTCQFDNGEKFYIILDLDGMELNFHGMMSEIQLYHIYKQF